MVATKIAILSGIAAVVIIGGLATYYYFSVNQSANEAALTEDDANFGSDIAIQSVLPADTTQYGFTYGEWTAKWWQWAVSIPQDNNPVVDNTGEFCAQGQSGPVWFLAGTYGGLAERSCNIPADTAILIPLINAECSEAEYPELTTETQRRGCAVEGNEGVTDLMFSINGESLEESELRSYRVQSPEFIMSLPENNIFGLPSGTSASVSDGFWIFLKPLPPGNHEIHARGGIIDPVEPANNFVTEVIYRIVVD